MSAYVCVTVHLLHPVFHGRALDDEPEWPPSPLRIFQALVAAGSWGHSGWSARRRRAFESLEETDQPPIVIAPVALSGEGYRLSVPNNSMDKVASAWSRGNYFGTGDASPAGHRTMKRVRPVHLPEGTAVHYVWRATNTALQDGDTFSELESVARRLVCAGWGVDMAVGDARQINDEELNALVGHRWLPVRIGARSGLRVPVQGTLNDLERRHRQFLERISPDGLRPPEPLTKFRVVEYRRASDPASRPVACFTLVRQEGGVRAFDPPRNTLRVAGMLRGATRRAADEAGGWPDPASFVLGHGENPGEKHRSVGNRRFAYLPLPSIQFRGPGRSAVIGSIRRVCLTVFEARYEDEVAWARRMLSGGELIQEETGEIVAILTPATEKDSALRPFLGSASDWASVSPVVLPGYDDPAHFRRRLAKGGVCTRDQRRMLDVLHHRVDKLLRKAIRDAGFSEELALHADLDWRATGFWPGTDFVTNYTVPSHLTRFPRLHVRIRWRDARGDCVHVSGPICLGGGRFFGIGLFAAIGGRHDKAGD